MARALGPGLGPSRAWARARAQAKAKPGLGPSQAKAKPILLKANQSQQHVLTLAGSESYKTGH